MIIGHEKTIQELKMLADAGSLGHGYIFFGPAMVGKRTVAQAFANYLENGIFGNDERILGDCKLIDLAHMKEVDPGSKDSIGIEAIQEIKHFLWQRPNRSRYRMVIIDEAERLTGDAQGAILKIAEEPPEFALIILVTNDIEGILPTVASRLMKIYFGTVSEKTIGDWLADRFSVVDKKSTIRNKAANKSKSKNVEAENADTIDAAARSFGKPGLALRILEDKEFSKLYADAEALMKKAAAARKEFLKKLMACDDFNFRKLLDAMILHVAASDIRDPKQAAFWHKLLNLRGKANSNPNPRLQIEALFVS